MKKVVLLLATALTLVSCGSSDKGELVGVNDRPNVLDMQPYGMVDVPQGSFTMGSADEDVYNSHKFEPKTVQVQSFWMDETEITNNEYRQFVYWVRDSIAYRLLGEVDPEKYLIEADQWGQDLETPQINWKAKIDWNSKNEDEREALEEGLLIKTDERYYNKQQLDATKLIYEYTWIDYHAAAQKDFSADQAAKDYRGSQFNNRPSALAGGRKQLTNLERVNIYPDTLCWIHDFAYSYNDESTRSYFDHPRYDNYPVVGVSYVQSKAFAAWRTLQMNNYLEKEEYARMADFRLPTEAEWEYAARGGVDGSPYPWGGPYVNNGRGCFLANYKPLRGAYDGDGGATTVVVAHYAPNDFGLYDMAGNVAEWCEDAFDASTYNFAHDINQYNTYRATDDDDMVMKRKVVRGGSWKDAKHFIQTATRTFEYQDSGKSYIGFRCVQSYLGRVRGDNPKTSSNVYRN
ncbi:MAG: SUMF1/EgtB/PvdO family nonheme iron enzyme [Bacteroidales bacterium]|nr:SUMF1/EgtB/PvdO family nonheme iron enzyme [Candidatus Scybalousia scybalohippi]MCQ2326012.1 SUMF1/EgtB/PvdO family nonheme iron enzyme [Bacteroidales bacterium]